MKLNHGKLMSVTKCTGVLSTLTVLLGSSVIWATDLQPALRAFLTAPGGQGQGLIDSFVEGGLITSTTNFQPKSGVNLNAELDFAGNYFTPLAVAFLTEADGTNITLAQALIANGGNVAQQKNKKGQVAAVTPLRGFSCDSDGTNC
ncbi:MAG TPA: hypothetical protein VJJ83_01315, partial [Candidatus Babeliales bacterium]|nr:hypothetical protein [Candidatus Babeliales bacterium]